MPTASKKACANPSCPRLCDGGLCGECKGRCATAASDYERQPDRKASKRFYSSKAWLALRREVLREEPLCRECAKQQRTRAADEVDHIVPRSVAPELELERSNLQPLCTAHHARKTRREGQ